MLHQMIMMLHQTNIIFTHDVIILLDVWNELFEAFIEDKMDRMGQPLFFGLIQRLQSSSLKVIVEIFAFNFKPKLLSLTNLVHFLKSCTQIIR